MAQLDRYDYLPVTLVRAYLIVQSKHWVTEGWRDGWLGGDHAGPGDFWGLSYGERGCGG